MASTTSINPHEPAAAAGVRYATSCTRGDTSYSEPAAMKRKASSAVPSPQEEDDDDVGREPRRAAPRLAVDDDFLVHEILPRLPALAARPFAAASASFRRVLTGRDYWRARRAPPPGPRVACLVVRGGSDGDGTDGGDARILHHEFHYADAACSPAPAVARAAAGSLATYRLACQRSPVLGSA